VQGPKNNNKYRVKERTNNSQPIQYDEEYEYNKEQSFYIMPNSSKLDDSREEDLSNDNQSDQSFIKSIRGPNM